MVNIRGVMMGFIMTILKTIDLHKWGLFMINSVSCLHSSTSIQTSELLEIKTTLFEIMPILNKLEHRVLAEIDNIREEMEDFDTISIHLGETNVPFFCNSGNSDEELFLKCEEKLGVLRGRYTGCWVRRIEKIYREEERLLGIEYPEYLDCIKINMKESCDKMTDCLDDFYSKSKVDIRAQQYECLYGDMNIFSSEGSIRIDTSSIEKWISYLNMSLKSIHHKVITILFELDDLDEYILISNDSYYNMRHFDLSVKLKFLISFLSLSTGELLRDMKRTRDMLKERIRSHYNSYSDFKRILSVIFVCSHDPYILPIDTILKDYKILALLGKGSYGNVYKCRNISTQKEVAIKTVLYDINECLNEARIMQGLQYNCPESVEFITELLGTFRYNTYLCMIFELFDTDLYTLNKTTNIEKEYGLSGMKKISRSVIKGIKILENEQILHRDIKPNNILINKDSLKVKIADFGNSCFFNHNVKNFGGLQNMYYKAPEIFRNKPCDASIDRWSSGCVLYELFTKKRLICGVKERLEEDLRKLLQEYEVVAASNRLEWFSFIVEPEDAIFRSLGIYELLLGLLRISPEERISSKEALEKLELIE
eukprot:GHVP01021567.1.p1 GENE.GHVP01021567.1~~GHVP01021567.1.p1  ORF type:complete len:596 (+),score=78.95 GHVP01021567.1:476-2263(+)